MALFGIAVLCSMLMMAIPDVEIVMFFLFHNMVLIYSPDSTDVYGSKGGNLRGWGWCEGLKVIKSCS